MLPDRKRFNLGYIASATAEADPQRVAIIDFPAGRERVTRYGELDERLDRVASFFVALGLRKGDRVAVIVGNRAEFVEVVYGALRCGCVPVMVNTKLGEADLTRSLRYVEASLAVVDPEVCAHALASVDQAGVAHRVLLEPARCAGWLPYEASVSASSSRFDAPDMASTDIADFCFTSGSSGAPKAVMTSHRAVLLKLYLYGNLIRSMSGGEIRTLVALPIFHANGRLSIGSALQTGGQVIIQPRFDAREALQNLTRYRVSYFLGVAPAYAAMLKEQDLLDSLDFSSLRQLFVGSASSGGDILARVVKALDVRIIHTYGSTEAGVVMQAEPRTEGFASCGRPFPGVEVKLIDPDSGEEGSSGELWVHTEWLAQGYWKQPELTAQRFVGGWYRSGDLFERDADGLYYVRGRIDDMFNVGGEKVYPGDVEKILQQHPDVMSVVVAPMAHATKGEVPGAMVIAKPGTHPDEASVREFFLAHGAAYAHPRRVVFVEAFPVASTGKVDRKAVRQRLEDRSQ